MSIQGKGNLSYKKQNVQKQNTPHTGVKNITFAHLFSNAGETTIPFDALVTPPEWSTSGLVNPTSQSLLSAQLQVFKNNVTVTSSARGLIQKSEYIVHGNRIEFKNITSLANEVFEVEVADILVTGNLIVDMQRIRVEGELADTETDFNMGYEFDTLNEEIIVFRDGIQMFRSDNNDSSGTTGNYYYVDTDGDGRSSVLSGTFTETLTVSKKIHLVGQGNSTIIDGTVSFNASSNNSAWHHVKFNNNITIANGVAGITLTDGYINPSAVLTDNNPTPDDNLYLLVEEL